LRRHHFEALKPVCPRCRLQRQQDIPLLLQTVLREEDDTVYEGVIHCPDPVCLLEYPIIDGIPLLLPDVRSYLADNLNYLVARDDLSATIETMLGDGAGPGTVFDTSRQHLSTYAWDSYGDLDPEEEHPTGAHEAPGAIVRCLDTGLDLLSRESAPPVIDMGCAVGRTTFELAARTDGLVLGVDVNFSMLQLAARVLGKERVSYPRRRIGVVYDRRDFAVSFPGADKVDFWACDALAPPFADDSFGFALGLNLLDCVTSPLALLQSIGRILRPGGQTLLSTPYDWSQATTPMEAWLGGHSQRGPGDGAAEPLLRSLLTPGQHPQSLHSLRIAGEIEDFPWHARVHERSNVSYSVHIVAAEATETK
jgi:SAM-dependent methyltransferase/uncharacterized protein YbaR (Trm112 family)